jgi:hypothetical protein
LDHDQSPAPRHRERPFAQQRIGLVNKTSTTQEPKSRIVKGKSRRRNRFKNSISEKQELFVYDGTTCIGRIVAKGKSACALDAAGLSIGKFSDSTSAFRCVSEAYLSAREARPSAPPDERGYPPELRRPAA